MSPAGARPWKALARAACSAGLALAASTAQAGCGDGLPAERLQRAGTGGWTLAFASSAWPVPVGEFFALDVVACPPGAVAVPAGDGTLAVDATMPAHRHGMNYRARVQPLGPGRWRVDGLMFHMPGLWRLSFELGSGSTTRRITHDIEVP